MQRNDKQTAEIGQRLLGELMLNFPGGASEDSDNALAAAVAVYLDLRAKQQHHSHKRMVQLFTKQVEEWMEGE